MTDRELLELAAKAAGLEIAKPSPAEEAALYRGSRNFLKLADGGWFAPLFDDGDALRLAVKLELSIIPDRTSKSMKVFSGTAPIWAEESRKENAFAATRRAIVRAAAEIGKAMP